VVKFPLNAMPSLSNTSGGERLNSSCRNRLPKQEIRLQHIRVFKVCNPIPHNRLRLVEESKDDGLG
jgi:hypothetical protein